MPRNVYCDQCEKAIGDDKLAYFSDVEKDLDFCSEECYSVWEKWKNIHPNFTPELQKEWEKKGFSYEECREWTKVGLQIENFLFCSWLKDKEKLTPKQLLNERGEPNLYLLCFLSSRHEKNLEKGNDIEALSSDYTLSKKGNKKEVLGQMWKTMFSLFEVGNDLKYTFQGDLNPNIGAYYDPGSQIPEAKDIDDILNHYYLTPHQISLINQQDNKRNEKLANSLVVQRLGGEVEESKFCLECQQPYTYGNSNWCQPCNIRHFQEDFKNWTSGNSVIDEFIQKYQLGSVNKYGVLEWVPYEKFSNLEYLAEGGFGKVYKADWSDGPIERWNDKDNKWERGGKFFNLLDFASGGKIVLKSLKNSEKVTIDFLQEIIFHDLCNSIWIVKCYGISQDPLTKDCIIVMEYAKGGNLRQYLSNDELTFEDRLGQLLSVVSGLNEIHKRGLIHCDFHPGNILDVGKNYCHITDLGLCHPADEVNKGKVYGVLPYVAPEILRGQPYTQKSDIYSFGIIAYELFTNFHLYPEMNDLNLSLAVCKGLRPDLKNIRIFQLLKDLITRCWDADPLKRPTSNQLYYILLDWRSCIYGKKDVEIYRQYKEITELKGFNKISSSNLYDKLLSNINYTSRLLDFKNLPEPQNSKEINDWFWNSRQNNISRSVDFDMSDLVKELEKQTKQLTVENWTNLNPNFTEELVQKWQNHGINHEQCRDWLSIGLRPTDHHFAAYLRDQKHLTPETALNQADYNQLKEEYRVYQLQSQQEQPPK